MSSASLSRPGSSNGRRSDEALIKLHIKTRVVRRLAREIQYRLEEKKSLEEEQAALWLKEKPKPEKHEVKRVADLVDEAQEALKVTLGCLERGCKDAEDYVLETYPDFYTQLRKACGQDVTEPDDVATGLRELLAALRIAENVHPLLKTQLKLLRFEETPVSSPSNDFDDSSSDINDI